MNNILALNSGGFDSVVMLNNIRDNNPETPITCLFFDYGQRNLVMERNAVIKSCNKLNCKYLEIKLPVFDWSSSNLYGEKFEQATEYLEMRNMIFLSYAFSIAESLHADTVYIATLLSLGYYDTSDEFMSHMTSIARDKGIELITPFSKCYKEDLEAYAFRYNITYDDFFSCNHPIDSKPCGVCPDCKILEDVMHHAEINLPIKAWLKTMSPYDPLFRKLYMEHSPTELRVLTNNDCQLKCEHCYYGFEEMKAPKLSLAEFRNVFEQSKELGITSYHFSGKEPLYDDSIFEVVKELRSVDPNADCTVVTNGINVPRFAQTMKDFNFSKVYLSVDDVLFSGIRSVQGVTHKAMTSLNQVGIPVEVFIDVHALNYKHIPDIVDYLYKKYGVTEFYIRVITMIGNAVKNNMGRFTVEQVNQPYEDLYKYLQTNDKVNVVYKVPLANNYDVLDSPEECAYQYALNNLFLYGLSRILPNFSIFPQFYCDKYEARVTVTPDGYIHGCASEMSSKDYDKLSPGNIRDIPLKDLIARGREMTLKINEREVNEDGSLKYFNCTVSNPLVEK